MTRANKELKKFLMGDLHPTCMILQRILNILQTMRWRSSTNPQRPVKWNKNSGGFVTNVRREMKKHGWQELHEFHWNHPALAQEINLEQVPEGKKKATLNRSAHRIREAWRVDCYAKWQAAGSRVAKLAVECPYSEARAKKVRELFQAQDGTGQTVMVGTWMSPAALASCCEGIDGKCLWCADLGHQEHICWGCPSTPEELKKSRPEKPEDPLKARLGWPKPRDKETKALEWIMMVAQEVWTQRYHDIRRVETRRAKDKKNEEQDEDPEDDGEDVTNWLEAETDTESEKEVNDGAIPAEEPEASKPKD